MRLSNVELKPTAFDGLQLPLRVRRGAVGKITLKVPWNALTSTPIELKIEDVHVLLEEREVSLVPSGGASGSFTILSRTPVNRWTGICAMIGTVLTKPGGLALLRSSSKLRRNRQLRSGDLLRSY